MQKTILIKNEEELIEYFGQSRSTLDNFTYYTTLNLIRISESENKMAEESVAQDQLRAFIERIERMEDEKAAVSADIKEIYSEAKGNGFDTKVIREIIRIRRQDASERQEHESILELYMSALGMSFVPSEE